MSITKTEALVLVLMYLAMFLACVCVSIPAPFLPKENELHGQSEAVTGAMLGFLPLVECVFTIIWGRLTLQIGVRNLVTGGLMTAGIATVFFGLLEFIRHESTLLYTICGFAIRTFQGIGTAAVVNSIIIILVDTFPGDSTLVLSIMACLAGVGMMSGPAIGSGLFLLGGFWLVFAGTGSLMVAVATVMVILLPKYDSREDEEPIHEVPCRKILNPRMLVGLAAGFFSAITWAGLDPILEPELRTSFCMDNLLVMIVGLSISTTAFLIAGPCPLFGLKNRLWRLMVCLSVMGLSKCLLYVPAQDVVFKIEKLNLSKDINRFAVRGFLSGLWRSGYSLGTFFGMTFSGAMYEAVGWGWTMTSYAVLSVVFIAAILFVKFNELRNPHFACRGECEDDTSEKEKLLE